MYRRPQTLILLISLLLALTAFNYRVNAIKSYHSIHKEHQSALAQIQKIKEFKRIWNGKMLLTRLNRLKRLFSPATFSTFTIKGHRAHIVAKGLDAKGLNRVLNNINSLPVQIVTLSIERHKKLYSMECRCRW